MKAAGMPLADARVLVDVGPASAFYSPFWALKAAVVGDIDPNHFKSTRDLLDAGVPISDYAFKTCPVRHPNVMPAPASGHMVEPTWGTELDDIPIVPAYFDGNAVTAFGFGLSTFSANAAAEVQPIPFFLFLTVTAEGPRILTPVRVGGVGPLFSGAKPDVGWAPSKDGTTLWPQPHFGAFWRVYGAVVPASAAPFTAADHAGATVPAGVDIKEYEQRVALDSTCFNGDLTLCTWLDSQAKIEQTLGAGNLIATEIMGTCPLVFYNKLPVKN
jgi:hypothetical protein